MKKLISILLACGLLLGCLALAEAASPEPVAEFLWYVHDPRKTPAPWRTSRRTRPPSTASSPARRALYIDTGRNGVLYQALKRAEDYAAALDAAHDSMNAIAVDGDVLLSVQERDDRWYVVTETEDQGVIDGRLAMINEFWTLDSEIGYQEGMKSRHYLVYDVASGDQLTCWSALCFPDGT